MPVTKSATKKMRADQKKAVDNLRQKRGLKDALKKAEASHTAETIRDAISKLDKAVKNHLIHANKAARLKSQLMKEAKSPQAAQPKPGAKKKAAKKKPVKKASSRK